MLTRKTQYALKALAHLANTKSGAPVLIATLAERENIPLKFLQLILRELRQKGVLQSHKGPGGGYSLAQPAEKLRLSTLLDGLEGPLGPLPCLAETECEPCDGCADRATCGLRNTLQAAHQAALAVLDTQTLADLALASAAGPARRVPTGRYAI